MQTYNILLGMGCDSHLERCKVLFIKATTLGNIRCDGYREESFGFVVEFDLAATFNLANNFSFQCVERVL